MRDQANIRAVAALKPDFMGFIFYPNSQRFVGDALNQALVRSLRPAIQTVGVFVNASIDEIVPIIEQYDFAGIQLHGVETPEYCRRLRAKTDVFIIKAFSIASEQDISAVGDYSDMIDFALFDTKTAQYGGSGKCFDWNILQSYSVTIPFFLSGGIGLDTADRIRHFHHPQLFALDINSRFEIAPALKDVRQIQAFTHNITMP